MTHIQRVSMMLTLGALTAVASSPGLAQERRSPSPSREGITVHGHWVIQVENPDGSVVTRREFENALTATGAGILARLLGREGSVGYWAVSLQNGPAGDAGPCALNGAPAACTIWENAPNFNPTPGNNSKTLTVSVPKDAQGSATGTVELSGNITTSHASGIGAVGTSLRYCFASVAPTDCATNQFGMSIGGVTHKALPSIIPVAAGQVIRVWVTLSFS